MRNSTALSSVKATLNPTASPFSPEKLKILHTDPVWLDILSARKNYHPKSATVTLCMDKLVSS